MNRLNILTAVWLDETVKTLTEIRVKADHIQRMQFDLVGNKIQNAVYANVRKAINEAIEKINVEFEKL